MKFGLTELFGNLRLFKGTTYVGFSPPSSIATSFTYTVPDALPTGGTKLLTCDTLGNWGYQDPSAGGGGTVTSVALSAPSVFSITGSPITGAGTLALAFATGQTANQFLATPNGAAGAVGLRAIAWGDVSGLAGSSSTSFAIGNDSRFHTQNTDTGTTQPSFILDSGGTPVRLKASAGTIQARNSGDTGFVDFAAANLTVNGNLTVSGTTLTVNSETVTIDDNILVLNNNVSTGTPTENGGLEVRRGASASATVLWDETTDEWRAGVVGTTLPVARVYRTTFTNSSLVGGTLTVAHNLGNQNVNCIIRDNNNRRILPDEDTATSTSALTIDLTSYGTIVGTWSVMVCG